MLSASVGVDETASARDVAVRVVNARKTYGKEDTEVTALGGVTVDFYSGQFTAIMGPSGSGKSTLMHTMAGLDDLDSGSILLSDEEVTTMKDKQLTVLRREKVGFVFQAFNLIPTLTARENITLPLSLAGRSVDDQWFQTVVKMVGLEDRLTHRPSELSGGQQQRVAVARALAARPDIVFADEPTGNLDSKSGTEVLQFLRRAADEFGQTVVMVTHDAHAASYAHRVIFLADGQVVDEMHDPTASAVLDRIKTLDS